MGGAVATERLFIALAELWGNQKWAAHYTFAKRAFEEASILPVGTQCVECGSGLTTLVIDAATANFTTLEDEAYEGARPPVALACSMKSTELYDWYDIPSGQIDWPVSLVVCDGPIGSTRGGRVGAIIELWPHLHETFTVLLDDYNRLGEMHCAQKWSEFALASGGSCEVLEVVECGDGRKFAVLRGRK